MSVYEQSIQKEKWYQKSVEETLDQLKTSNEGITAEESKKRLETQGPNKLKEPEKEPGWKKFLESFKDYLVMILIGAAVFASIEAAIEGKPPIDAIVISSILILNAILGYFQDKQAEEALEALKKMSAQKARVVRGQDLIEEFAEELVPGDVVALETGDQVPADVRMIEALEFKTDEASLTGESQAIKKTTEKIAKECTVGDRINLAYSSTVVTYGRGKGVVVATGMNTEVGKIATALEETEEEETPLTKKMNKFGKLLGNVILAVCGLTFVLILFQEGTPVHWANPVGIVLTSIMAAVALAVAAVPEGLPAIITTSLALGVKKMAKRNAIVRALPAVETLGCTTVICSDKTGTLTKNEMTIRNVYVDGEMIEVEGSGYEPIGGFKMGADKIDASKHKDLNLLARIGVFSNNATLRKDDKGRWVITGDPTEAAFLTLGGKLDTSREKLSKKYRRVSEVFFSSERKKMSTVDMDNESESFMVSMKGGLEPMLPNITRILVKGEVRKITKADIDDMMKAQDTMANQALRVLGCAYKEWKKAEVDLDPEKVEKDLILVGLVGMIDPPRLEVKGAVALCKSAGIKTVMITGDHANTAKAIAMELGILPPKLEDGHRHLIQGTEIDTVSDKEILECNVFARVSPEHKMRIVKTLQEAGNIVSMTGDGVNDAPALKRADAGVAMGITGTDVAKGAAKIILADDNFASIVNAVDEGRAIYDNMKRFINYLLGCNFSEIAIMTLCVIVMLPIPLEAIHLLWINLLTDGLPALAMGFEKPDSDVMQRPPRPPNESIITKRNWLTYFASTATLTIAELVMFLYGLNLVQPVTLAGYDVSALGFQSYYWLADAANRGTINAALTAAGVPAAGMDLAYGEMLKELLSHPRTLVFACMILGEMFMAINCRSETTSVFKKKFSDNPWLFGAIGLSLGLSILIIYWDAADIVFDLRYLTIVDWGLMVLLCLPIFGAEELVKLYWKKTHAIHYVEQKEQW